MSNGIGAKLKHLRKVRGLTQQQLSEKIGLSRCTLSNYECQRRLPHLNELRLLCDFFGVSMDYWGVETKNEQLELLSRAKNVFLNKDIPKEERENLYKQIMKIYLEIED